MWLTVATAVTVDKARPALLVLTGLLVRKARRVLLARLVAMAATERRALLESPARRVKPARPARMAAMASTASQVRPGSPGKTGLRRHALPLFRGAAPSLATRPRFSRLGWPSSADRRAGMPCRFVIPTAA